jgi:hypothetical protein
MAGFFCDWVISSISSLFGFQDSESKNMPLPLSVFMPIREISYRKLNTYMS